MIDYCKTCKHDDDIGFCDKCFYNHVLEERGIPPTEYEVNSKPTTNYDRIRAMSVEEMAEFLTLIMMGEERSVPFIYSTVDKWLDWLKQEVDDAD